MRSRDAGFTLLELLIAMAVFMFLGIALVQLITRSFDFLGSGSQSGEVSDQLQVFARQFGEDARSVFVLRRITGVRPDVRMIHRTIPWDLEVEDESSRRGRKKTIRIEAPMLGFVRTIKGEEKGRLTRLAGSKPGGEAYLDMDDDEREAKEGRLRALGGLMEVLYVAVPQADTSGATWTLYRAMRSPIGGEGSLLDVEELKSEDDLKDLNAVPILTGVLHLDFRFWGHDTESWEDKLPAGSGGPYRTWDSTRGLLKVDGRDGFPLARGEISLTDPTDDVFPRRVRARLVLTPVGRGARFARLTKDVGDREEERELEIDPPTIVPASVGASDKFLKVGPEWFEFSSRVGSVFRIASRGLRGTPRLRHTRGTPVQFGQTWEISISIPAFREELPTR